VSVRGRLRETEAVLRGSSGEAPWVLDAADGHWF